jgi:hypothetical protein
MKIHSKSVNLNAKILRKVHILSLWHGRLDFRKHPFFDPPYSTYQDLSNDTNYVKIGRWDPGVLGRQRGGDKVKNIHK